MTDTNKTNGKRPVASSPPRRKATEPSTKTKSPDAKAWIIESQDGDVIRSELAEKMPEWGSLTISDQDEIVRRTIAFWQREGGVGFRQVDGVVTQAGNATLQALRISDALASQSGEYTDHRLNDLSRAQRGDPSVSRLSADFAFVQGVGAQDTVQSTLAVQMVATHAAGLRAIQLSTNSDNLNQVVTMGNLGVKLMNTFARQAEVLAKLQRGGEQTIKHIHIDNRGGQAVVADQVVTGGSRTEDGSRAYEPIAALLGSDPAGNGVPVPGDAGQETLSPSWRGQGVRRSDRQSERAQERALHGEGEIL